MNVSRLRPDSTRTRSTQRLLPQRLLRVVEQGVLLQAAAPERRGAGAVTAARASSTDPNRSLTSRSSVVGMAIGGSMYSNPTASDNANAEDVEGAKVRRKSLLLQT